MYQQGQYEAAVPKAQSFVERFPIHPLGWTVLGAIYRAQHRNDEALICLQRLITLAPRDANSHFNLANTLRDLGRASDSVEPYRTALKLKPELPRGFFHLGNMQHEAGLLTAAETSLRKAVQAEPGHIEARSNLAHLLQDMGRLDEALDTYDKALELEPHNAVLHYNRGDALSELGRLKDAERSARTTIGLAPDMALARAQLGDTLQRTGELPAAVAAYQAALNLAPDNTDIRSSLLFALNYLPAADRATCLAQARIYGQTVAAKAKASCFSWSGNLAPVTLRVGLVSADLRNHPVGYFLEGILAQVDTHRIELIGITTQTFEDDLTERIRPFFNEWHSLSGLDEAAASGVLSKLGLHVLLDLSGHTAGNRLPLFAQRLAPVQASWLGYFATTGVQQMDFFLADPVSLPKHCERDFTESVWHLPETRLCFTPPQNDIHANPLPALKNPGVTFGSCSNVTKLNDEVIMLWSRILCSLPSSRLLLQAKQLGSGEMRDTLAARFAKHGVEAHQLTLRGPMPRHLYLRVYHEIDMSLDPFPFPGGTTTAESLWMGVPVLTLCGDHFIARQGAALLMAAGLPDWIATTTDDYLARALRLATDIAGLAALRSVLRDRVLASPIFDAVRFAKHFESALWAMWEQKKPR